MDRGVGIGSGIVDRADVTGIAARPAFPSVDLRAMPAAAAVLFPFDSGHRKMTRPVGAALLASYVARAADALGAAA